MDKKGSDGINTRGIMMRRGFFIGIGVLIFVLSVLWCSKLQAREIIETRGGKVKVVKYDDGAWQLFVEDKPYFIKGVMFVPVKIGESPDSGTMRDWTYYDDDGDGKNDIGFQTWVDTNKNNKHDADESAEGDFSLLKKMGANTIRLYHVASDNSLLGDIYKKSPSTALQFDHSVHKTLLRRLYQEYGIRVIMGNFLGAWTIGSGAAWEGGTDYTNAEHCDNIKKSIKAMVLDNKDEPYVLFWLLGNENNIASWSHCNAAQQPQAYARLIGELARMIHELDPDHPVAVCEGDNFNTLRLYPQCAPDIDIIGYNAYRGKQGFGFLWKEAKRIFDRPVFISEFGQFAYNIKTGEDENLQLEHIRGCWQDIVANSIYSHDASKGMGNSLGGIVFDWLDRWYMDGKASQHNAGTKAWDSPDGLDHEEWFGLMSMGDGSDSLMRQKRKAVQYLEKTWNEK